MSGEAAEERKPRFESPEDWAILEIMGHRQVAGLISEQEVFGGRWVRIAVPEVPEVPEVPAHQEEDEEGEFTAPAVAALAAIPGYTQFFGPSAIFSITLVTEEAARAAAARFRMAAPGGAP